MKTQTIYIIIGAVVVVGLVWWFMGRGKNGTSSTSSPTA